MTSQGRPLRIDRRFRRKDLPRCGARTRAGRRCLVRVEPGKRRCRFHGGLSTGPKTEAGRARIAEAHRRRWRAYRDKGRPGNAAHEPAKAQEHALEDVWGGYRFWE